MDWGFTAGLFLQGLCEQERGGNPRQLDGFLAGRARDRRRLRRHQRQLPASPLTGRTAADHDARAEVSCRRRVRIVVGHLVVCFVLLLRSAGQCSESLQLVEW